MYQVSQGLVCHSPAVCGPLAAANASGTPSDTAVYRAFGLQYWIVVEMILLTAFSRVAYIGRAERAAGQCRQIFR